MKAILFHRVLLNRTGIVEVMNGLDGGWHNRDEIAVFNTAACI